MTMTRRISTLSLIAIALTSLPACDTPSVGPVRGAAITGAPAPTQEEPEVSLAKKWLTSKPTGVNGMLGI